MISTEEGQGTGVFLFCDRIRKFLVLSRCNQHEQGNVLPVSFPDPLFPVSDSPSSWFCIGRAVQNITSSTTSLDDARPESFQLSPQLFDVNFDCIGEAVKLVAPDRIKNPGPGENCSWMFQEQAEQGKFLGGEIERLPVARGLLRGEIRPNIQVFQNQS